MDQYEAPVVDIAEGKLRRNRKSLSKALQLKIFRRDGWLCYWCKRPVIFAPAMRFLELEVMNTGHPAPLAYHHAHWTREGSPLIDELGAAIDHVEPFSSGGACGEANLRTSCSRCNMRKSSAPVATWEQREMRRPVKGKYGEPQDWDGLAAVFLLLAERHPTQLKGGEKEWLKALKLVFAHPAVPVCAVQPKLENVRTIFNE